MNENQLAQNYTMIPKTRNIVGSYFLPAILALCACSPNPTVLNSNREEAVFAPSNLERPVESFEKDLESMRTADFDYIFVLRRRDRALMDAEDRNLIKIATADANRRKLSDNEKAIIVASNYNLDPKSLELLGLRFAVENYSKPDDVILQQKSQNRER